MVVLAVGRDFIEWGHQIICNTNIQPIGSPLDMPHCSSSDFYFGLRSKRKLLNILFYLNPYLCVRMAKRKLQATRTFVHYAVLTRGRGDVLAMRVISFWRD
jgi:hypothetical protein